MIKKLFFLSCLIALSVSYFTTGLPDAVKCGNQGYVFWAKQLQPTGVSTYCSDSKCISYRADGSYDSHSGLSSSERAGCQGVSLTDLYNAGKTFELARP